MMPTRTANEIPGREARQTRLRRRSGQLAIAGLLFFVIWLMVDSFIFQREGAGTVQYDNPWLRLLSVVSAILAAGSVPAILVFLSLKQGICRWLLRVGTVLLLVGMIIQLAAEALSGSWPAEHGIGAVVLLELILNGGLHVLSIGVAAIAAVLLTRMLTTLTGRTSMRSSSDKPKLWAIVGICGVMLFGSVSELLARHPEVSLSSARQPDLYALLTTMYVASLTSAFIFSITSIYALAWLGSLTAYRRLHKNEQQ